MSDALTLAEARKQYNRAVEGPSQEKEEAAFVVLLAAHLRALAGTPDSETMEQAMNAFREAATVEMQLGKRLDRQEEAGLHAAYPLLVAPLRAEVERLKGDLFGQRNIADARKADLDKMEERLATAEARVRELGDAVRGLLHVIRADQLVPESVSYMKMAAKAVGMEAE